MDYGIKQDQKKMTVLIAKKMRDKRVVCNSKYIEFKENDLYIKQAKIPQEINTITIDNTIFKINNSFEYFIDIKPIIGESGYYVRLFFIDQYNEENDGCCIVLDYDEYITISDMENVNGILISTKKFDKDILVEKEDHVYDYPLYETNITSLHDGIYEAEIKLKKIAISVNVNPEFRLVKFSGYSSDVISEVNRSIYLLEKYKEEILDIFDMQYEYEGGKPVYFAKLFYTDRNVYKVLIHSDTNSVVIGTDNIIRVNMIGFLKMIDSNPNLRFISNNTYVSRYNDKNYVNYDELITLSASLLNDYSTGNIDEGNKKYEKFIELIYASNDNIRTLYEYESVFVINSTNEYLFTVDKLEEIINKVNTQNIIVNNKSE